ncbi:DUF255 domain-containing protein [Ruegeria litorea]|uniref:DUF255 domain-containing protein n=1 Tax=Falsiruegeria litorea TaxID=1280831 RepID=A0ABS5WUQ9_9RHOB|nr:DUF255 domain-containing protein [Falsiruegeria litorea]MBT3142426.1 DUF255 domain-containing protein [Falsiruegeria litorea]
MKWFIFCVFGMLATFANAAGREANHLQGAASPYLLQHLYNPVDWYPWGPEALNKAKTEGKLIFVSVGYSACHWCHVMEQESFENEQIAAALNESFVSIKVDRESDPDLDARFLMTTKVMTGGGGWPNSVFLTPEGGPVLAGGYVPAAEFLSVITQIHHDWVRDPVSIRLKANQVSKVISAQLQQKAEALEVSQDMVQGIVDTLLDDMDPFNGGYGIVPKFPREPLFLFLLDHAERTGDVEVLGVVTDMLDGMIQGGVHDHVGGGFHRYAVDPEWNEPHFEKMLYTQALMGRLLVRAWEITGTPEHRRAAERLFDYVLRDLRDANGGFFASQNADSKSSTGESIEGAFYTWPTAVLDRLDRSGALRRDLVLPTPKGQVSPREILALRASVMEMAQENGRPVGETQAALDRLLQQLFDLRQTRPAPFVDRKIIVSWNAAMIETLAHAGHHFERLDYTEAAAKAARFILAEMQMPSGLNRVWYNQRPSEPARLADYAGFGRALIALHDYAPSPDIAGDWLDHAQAFANEIGKRFGSAKDGFRMSQETLGQHAIVLIEDADLPSGNALALDLFTQLALRTEAPGLQQDAYALASALSGGVLHSPEKRSYFLKAVQDLKVGATGPVRFAANGAVRGELNHDKTTNIATVQISIAQGWHINADQPLQRHLIPTQVSVSGAKGALEYPSPHIKTLAFNDAPLALYEGNIAISAQLTPSPGNTIVPRITLVLQACSEEICLQPEELIFTIWPTAMQK